jgi:predicted dehydrogenase
MCFYAPLSANSESLANSGAKAQSFKLRSRRCLRSTLWYNLSLMTTRVAVVGLGAVWRHVHLPAFAQLRHRVRVVAGCDSDPAAREQAQRNGVSEVFATITEMLEKSCPDVVAVCTPPALHREHVIAALAHGCHVFCEKPLTDDLAATDEILRVSDRAQRRVAVNTQYPYMKIHAAARQLIGSPEFGRLLYLHVRHMRWPYQDTGWTAQLRRRLCADMGVHVFELMRFFFDDDPVRIGAQMPDPQKTGRDVVNFVAVEFADGRSASALLNRMSPGEERFLDIRLDGEHASIQTAIETRCRVCVGLKPGTRRPLLEWEVFRGGTAALQKGARRECIASEGGNPWVSGTAQHFADFLRDLESGSEPRYSARHHRTTLAMVHAAYDSAETARTLDLAPYYLPTQTRSAGAEN